MNESIAFALAAMVMYGLSDVAYKRGVQAGAKPHQFLMVQTWVLLPLVLVYGVATKSLQMVPAALWGTVAGVFSYAAFILFAKSLRLGAVTIVVPVFRLGFVVTALLAVAFLSESVTVLKTLGLGFAIVAVWLLLGSRVSGQSLMNKKAAILVVAATVAIGISNFLSKVGIVQGASPSSVLFAQAIGIAILATVASAMTDKGLSIFTPSRRWGPLAGLLLSVAFILMMLGLAVGDASVVVPIAQFGFVVAAIIGYLFLREPVTARKLCGLASAIAAVGLLGVASS